MVTDWLISGRMGALLYDVPANPCASHDTHRLLSTSAEYDRTQNFVRLNLMMARWSLCRLRERGEPWLALVKKQCGRQSQQHRHGACQVLSPDVFGAQGRLCRLQTAPKCPTQAILTAMHTMCRYQPKRVPLYAVVGLTLASEAFSLGSMTHS